MHRNTLTTSPASTERSNSVRLRAVLFLDACGYSRAVRLAETAALREVRAGLDLAAKVVDEFGGEVLSFVGDGLYAAFASAGAAVDAALEIRRHLANPDATLLEGYRIGVHLGDTFEMDGQIIGDAVNIAERIESVGAPGTVLVSKNVRDTLLGRADLTFASLGNPFLKNLGSSIEVFSVVRSSRETHRCMRLRLLGPVELKTAEGTIVPLTPEQIMVLAMVAISPGGLDASSIVSTLWGGDTDEHENEHLIHTIEALNSLSGADEPVGYDAATGRVSIDPGVISVDIDAELDAQRAGAAKELLDGFQEGTPTFLTWLHQIRTDLRHRRRSIAEQRTAIGRHVLARATETLTQVEQRHFVVGLLPTIVEGDQNKANFVSNVVAELMLKSLSETEAVEVHDFRVRNAEDGALPVPTYGVGPDLFLQCRTLSCESMLQVSVTALRAEDRKVIWSQNVVADQNDFLGLSSASVMSFVSYATDALLSALAAGRHMRDPAAHHAAKKAISAVHHLLSMTGPGLDKLEADILAAYEIDPKPVYLAWLAYVTTFQVGERYGKWDAELEDRARELARRAIEDDPNNGTVLGLVTHVHSYVFRDFAMAEELKNAALEISPYRAMCWDSAALLYSYTGRPVEAMKAAETARNLGRLSPYRHLFDGACCVASVASGDFKRAAQFGERVMAVQPEFKTVMRYLAAAYGHLGDRERGETALKRLVELEPDISLDRIKGERFPVPTPFAARLLETGLTQIGLTRHG